MRIKGKIDSDHQPVKVIIREREREREKQRVSKGSME